jgi:hypothetical protein
MGIRKNVNYKYIFDRVYKKEKRQECRHFSWKIAENYNWVIKMLKYNVVNAYLPE